MSKKKKLKKLTRKPHPWRKCPMGKHWVEKHQRKVKMSEKNPDGKTSVKGYCRDNPSKKDQIYPEELKLISEKYFSELLTLPKKDNLDFKWRGNRYDKAIAGWVKYWNEVLKPKDPLDPNLIKALIATESSFVRDSEVFAGKRAGKARGLMQVTDWTLEILRDEKGELRDHLVNVTQKQMADPDLNIAAGVRWLFRKKETASAKLKRTATWPEAVADYKSYLREWQKDSKHKQMNKFLKLYERLRKQ